MIEKLREKFEGDETNPRDVAEFAKTLGVLEEFNKRHGITREAGYEGETEVELFVDKMEAFSDRHVSGAFLKTS